jgi:phenylpyruvate tautomerase PptA (4-oxalocrotonate tautomerase family)
MPFVQVHLRQGKPKPYKKAILDGIYDAMLGAFKVPADDQFMTIREYEDDHFVYNRSYLGIARSDDFVIIQITANNTRTVEQKQAFYKKIADNLTASPGMRPEDIFISLVDVPKENWSFGNGIAQYA